MAAHMRQDAEGTQMRAGSVARMTATRMGGFFCALWLLVVGQWPMCSREGAQGSMVGRSRIDLWKQRSVCRRPVQGLVAPVACAL